MLHSLVDDHIDEGRIHVINSVAINSVALIDKHFDVDVCDYFFSEEVVERSSNAVLTIFDDTARSFEQSANRVYYFGQGGNAIIAEESDRKIILVTHFADSPGAQFVDVVLLCRTQVSPLQIGAVATKIAMLHVIDLMFHNYCSRHIEESQAAMQESARTAAQKSL